MTSYKIKVDESEVDEETLKNLQMAWDKLSSKLELENDEHIKNWKKLIKKQEKSTLGEKIRTMYIAVKYAKVVIAAEREFAKIDQTNGRPTPTSTRREGKIKLKVMKLI